MWEVLCFAFVVQSILFPDDLMNTGFLLSYGSLTGIVLLSDYFRKLYSFLFPKVLASSFGASTGAQCFSFPVSLKLFGSVSPIGIISGVCISPLITIFIYSGLIFIILGFIFPPLIRFGGIFMQIQYNLIDKMVSLFSKVPLISLR